MLDPIVLREISIGVWSAVAGYYWLLFVYFGLILYKKQKKQFFSFLSLFFLLLAIGRIFFIAYDFYFPLPPHNIFWRMGISAQWLSLGAASMIIGIIIFDNPKKSYYLTLPTIGFAIINLLLPDVLLQLINLPLNYGIAFIYAIIIPILLLYVASSSPGIIRTGFTEMGIGFLIVYAGRALHSETIRLLISPIIGDVLANLFPPALAVLGLIFIVSGQNQAFGN